MSGRRPRRCEGVHGGVVKAKAASRGHGLAKLIAGVGAILALALAPDVASAVTVSYPFNSDDQGWRSVEIDCQNYAPTPPTWSSTDGNPGGAVADQDTEEIFGGTESCFWLLGGPAATRGNLKGNYGGSVSFDVKAAIAAPNQPPAVVIVDTQGNALAAQEPSPPLASTWHTVSFTIDETSLAWEFVDSQGNQSLATQADFLSVLGDVGATYLLGDLVNGSSHHVTSFDNIALADSPLPLDSDGDGVNNVADNCPTTPGPISNNGCPIPPDSDGDGVPDASDACPTVAGPASNNGCPLPPAKDTDPPETTITKKPAKVSSSTKAKFKFAADEPGSTFKCKLDKGALKPCTSPKRLKKLKPGKHTFSVRAIDASGNADSTPAKWKWKVSG